MFTVTEIDELSAELQRVCADGGAPDFFPRFEGVVTQFAVLDDPATIPVLLEFLDDEVDDVLLFGIVHTVERFDSPVYVRELLSVLPVVAGRTKRWAMIMVLRLLNSPDTLSVVTDQMPALCDDSRLALHSTLVDLFAWAPEFTERSEALLVELA